MTPTTTLKLQVELAFPAAEKHDLGRAQASVALRDEADRLGLAIDLDSVMSSGPAWVRGESWDGTGGKVYDHQLFFAWAWCEVAS